MKRVIGLFEKEWISNKWNFVYLLLGNFMAIFGLPAAMNLLHPFPQHEYYSATLNVTVFWLMLIIFSGMFFMLGSLNGEMKTPEVWLHSPATMLELVGVKAIFSFLITAFALFTAFFFFFVYHLLSMDSGKLNLTEIPIIPLFGSFLLQAIYLIGIGFFFWAIYIVLKSRIGNFAIFITLILYFLISTVWKIINKSTLFHRINDWIPLDLNGNFFDKVAPTYFLLGVTIDTTMTSVGLLLKMLVITVILFLLGITLFEKRVRY